MKKLAYFLVAAICMMAVGCTDEAGAFRNFRLVDPSFVDADGSKVVFNYSSSKLHYEDDDQIYVNGVLFTLEDQGSQWVANSSTGDEVENVNNLFYVGYADNTALTNFNSSTGAYTFNLSSKVNVQPVNPTVTTDAHSTSTNGIIIAGASSENLVHLYPACAIIRLATNQAYTYVKVGFDANKVPYKGTLLATTSSASISSSGALYLEGVTSDANGSFLYMIKCDDGWYVAVPIVGNSVTTTLYFEWSDGSVTTKYKTQGQVELTKGYVYSVGNSNPTPFNPVGFTKSRFEVDEFGTKVRFASGNLQYIPDPLNLDPDTWENGIKWRLAPHQYDEIGSANSSISLGSDNDSYIDLFGWGTSGWNSGASQYMPYSRHTSYSQYNTSSSIAGTNADWGKYGMVKGNIFYGNKVVTGSARTLTYDEWTYLLSRDSGHKYGLATIGGVYKGLVLIPDTKASGGSWTLPAGCTFNYGTGSGYTTNEYSFEQWDAMELQGAVFLPTTGYRSNVTVTNPSTEGFYWSTDEKNVGQCYALQITSSSVTMVGKSRAQGCAVRLVL